MIIAIVFKRSKLRENGPYVALLDLLSAEGGIFKFLSILSHNLFIFDWRGETSEVSVVRRAAKLLATILLANSIVSTKLVNSKPVSKHLLAVMCV